MNVEIGTVAAYFVSNFRYCVFAVPAVNRRNEMLKIEAYAAQTVTNF